jgi:hypothetical protein
LLLHLQLVYCSSKLSTHQEVKNKDYMAKLFLNIARAVRCHARALLGSTQPPVWPTIICSIFFFLRLLFVAKTHPFVIDSIVVVLRQTASHASSHALVLPPWILRFPLLMPARLPFQPNLSSYPLMWNHQILHVTIHMHDHVLLHLDNELLFSTDFHPTFKIPWFVLNFVHWYLNFGRVSDGGLNLVSIWSVMAAWIQYS